MIKKREPTMEEIRKIVLLCANENTVIVGGMAVSLLAEIYGVSTDVPCMTTDGDLLGGQMAIEESEKQLAGYALRKYLATLDEQATPNSGKLAVDIDGEVDPVELDFLFRIDGLSTDEIEQKAARIEVDGKSVRVMHPVLLLENKLNNLALYPTKRNDAGVNQARLAIAIAQSYLKRLVDAGGDQRQVLQVIERIARFAQREASCYVYKAFGLDALDAVPDPESISLQFAGKRWPQIRKVVAEHREKFDRLWERMARVSDPKTKRFRI